MKYLVDSDWLIDLMTGQAIAERVLDECSSEGLAISIVTLGELFEGVVAYSDASTRLDEIRTLVANYTVLALTDPIMELFAHTRSNMRRQGQLIPDFDILIASTARYYNLTLITRNVRHFGRIPDLRLLTADDT